MKMLDPAALDCLAALVDEGSFERAAHRLAITQSAVSQRLRALEMQIGQPLVVRSRPLRLTGPGQVLLRYARQLQALRSDVARDLGERIDVEDRVPIAVNADSLATWVLPALADFHARTGDTVALQVDDQDHTREWLKNGTVIGAVTTAAEPLAGCRVDALGQMSYVAAVSPAFRARYFEGRTLVEGFRSAPMLVFNQKDLMQHRFLRQVAGEDCHPPQWWGFSTQSFLEAGLIGMGWGLHPRPLVAEMLADGRLVDLCPGHSLTVTLYWQSWRLESARVKLLRECLWRASSAVLEPGA